MAVIRIRPLDVKDQALVFGAHRHFRTPFVVVASGRALDVHPHSAIPTRCSDVIATVRVGTYPATQLAVREEMRHIETILWSPASNS